MKKVHVVSGDLTQIPCDAIITAVNSGGMWFGGIDGAIMRASGDLFHNQASKSALPLKHGATVVAKSNGKKHGGEFNNMVFVIDDLCGPLNEIILNGLVAASGRLASKPSVFPQFAWVSCSAWWRSQNRKLSAKWSAGSLVSLTRTLRLPSSASNSWSMSTPKRRHC